MTSIFGAITYETPKYTVLQKMSTYEIRQYTRQLRAEVEVEYQGPMSTNLGMPLRMLSAYIYGENIKRSRPESEEKLKMKPEVVLEQQKEKKEAKEVEVMMEASAPNEKMEMTAPMIISKLSAEKNLMKMSFVMPSKYTSVGELPLPKDAKVHLVEVPEHKIAALRFSGFFVDSNFKAKEAALRKAAAADGVKLSEDPAQVQLASYNPPWCLPFLKTNEVLIPIVE